MNEASNARSAATMMQYVKTILTGQFEAALCMLNDCLLRCPPEHWEGKIANDSFRQIAYHTLFFVDLYMSPTEEAFALRDFPQNNLRHVQHHTGQLSAFLRRVAEDGERWWVGTGWR